MKLKFNLGIFKGKKICFKNEGIFVCSGIVDTAKSKSEKCIFNLFHNRDITKVEVPDIIIMKCLIKKNNDEIIFDHYPNDKFISGMVAFTMFNTYGFPVELTEEILGENGYKVDIEGFNILRDLQKELASGTFKNNDVWNSK